MIVLKDRIRIPKIVLYLDPYYKKHYGLVLEDQGFHYTVYIIKTEPSPRIGTVRVGGIDLWAQCVCRTIKNEQETIEILQQSI